MKIKFNEENPLFRFITNTVVILIAIGVILIVVGVTGFITKFISDSYARFKEPIENILKTTGAAILGGGVFSALVQSARFTSVYQKVFENVLWSNDFLKKRGDIRDIWNNVSRLLYQEKFPHLSNEIEEIITTEYFPTNHNVYIENYDLTVTFIEKNENYLEHVEYLNVTLIPAKGKTGLCYNFGSYIDVPKSIEDETKVTVDQLILNGEEVSVTDQILEYANTDCQHIYKFNLLLPDGLKEHNVNIKRTKILERYTNRDKRFFANYFQKDVSVTIIAPVNLRIGFYSMGTTKDFIKSSEQVNNGLRILKYYYNGLILPKQGFLILVD